MNTSNVKHMPTDAAPGSQHANTHDQSPEGKTGKAAPALDPKSAKHVCTPACTHEGAKKDMSTPGGATGTLHTSADHDKSGGGAARGGR
jgi:hypothetical protein